MSLPKEKFFATWLVTCMVVVVVLGTINALVDPYLLFDAPRVIGFNARKPAAATQQRMMKSYDVVRFKPNSVVLGSSRVNAGIDTQRGPWPSAFRPTYNMGFDGGGPYVAHRYLQHVMAYRGLALVIMGLDFEYFLDWKRESSREAEYQSRLAVMLNGAPNQGQRQQHLVDLMRTLALNSTKDSVATMFANLAGEGRDIIDGNMNGVDSIYPYKKGFLLNYYNLNLLWIRAFNRVATKTEIKASEMLQLKSVLDLCESHGTRVVFFINPVHADLLDIYDRAGLWPLYEDWKRELTTLVAKYSNRSDNALLWDFSGYHTLSTESVSLEIPLRMYWDASHYRPVVGDAIITRIFDGGDPRFGAVLTPENVEAHLATIRSQQRSYREHQPIDAARVQKLYDAAVLDLVRVKH